MSSVEVAAGTATGEAEVDIVNGLMDRTRVETWDSVSNLTEPWFKVFPPFVPFRMNPWDSFANFKISMENLDYICLK